VITDVDKIHPERAMTLAEQALGKGNEPLGSVLMSEKSDVHFEDPNHIGTGDHNLQLQAVLKKSPTFPSALSTALLKVKAL